MLNPRYMVKILSMVGLLAGLSGAIQLSRAVQPGRRGLLPPYLEKDRRQTLESLLNGRRYKSGIRLIFLGFLAQFFSILCQLLNY